MYEYEYTLETTASAETIFHFFEDVSTWPTWDTGTEKVELFGSFVPGTQGKMYLVGQDPLDFTLIAVEPNRSFADETPVPHMGISVIFNHILTTLANGGTRIMWQVTIDGPAAEELGPQIGPMITGDTPEAVANLVRLAESKSSVAVLDIAG